MTEHLSRMHTFWRWLAGGLVIVALGSFAVLQQTGREREVRSMPDSERRALYQRMLETVKTTCTDAAVSTLKEYCRNQAEFIWLFPECDEDCRARVLQLTSSPAR